MTITGSDHDFIYTIFGLGTSHASFWAEREGKAYSTRPMGSSLRPVYEDYSRLHSGIELKSQCYTLLRVVYEFSAIGASADEREMNCKQKEEIFPGRLL